jgi:hypothetical protein
MRETAAEKGPCRMASNDKRGTRGSVELRAYYKHRNIGEVWKTRRKSEGHVHVTSKTGPCQATEEDPLFAFQLSFIPHSMVSIADERNAPENYSV